MNMEIFAISSLSARFLFLPYPSYFIHANSEDLVYFLNGRIKPTYHALKMAIIECNHYVVHSGPLFTWAD